MIPVIALLIGSRASPRMTQHRTMSRDARTSGETGARNKC